MTNTPVRRVPDALTNDRIDFLVEALGRMPVSGPADRVRALIDELDVLKSALIEMKQPEDKEKRDA